MSTIDWYSLTCDVPSYPAGAVMRGVSLERGMLGYTIGIRFLDGRLELQNPDRPDMKTHIVYSGSCLEYLFSECGVSPLAVVNTACAGERVSRVDLAIDVLGGSLDIGGLSAQVDAGKHNSRAKKFSYFRTLSEPGETLYVGSPRSKVRLRIYDKAAERGLSGYEWTRLELQVRGKRAHSTIAAIRRANSLNSTSSLIKGFCDFPGNLDYALVVGRECVGIAVPQPSEPNTRQWLLNSVADTIGREIAMDEAGLFTRLFRDAIAESVKKYRGQIIDLGSPKK